MQLEEKQGWEGTRGTSSRAGRCMVTFIQAMVGDLQASVSGARSRWLVAGAGYQPPTFDLHQPRPFLSGTTANSKPSTGHLREIAMTCSTSNTGFLCLDPAGSFLGPYCFV